MAPKPITQIQIPGGGEICVRAATNSTIAHSIADQTSSLRRRGCGIALTRWTSAMKPARTQKATRTSIRLYITCCGGCRGTRRSLRKADEGCMMVDGPSMP
jgi:hypothetical protein